MIIHIVGTNTFSTFLLILKGSIVLLAFHVKAMSIIAGIQGMFQSLLINTENKKKRLADFTT